MISLKSTKITNTNVELFTEFILKAKINHLDEYLRKDIVSILRNSEAVVTSSTDQNITSALFLYKGDDPKILFINPGNLLGGSLIIKQGLLDNKIVKLMIEEAIRWSTEHGFQELSFTRDQNKIDFEESKILEDLTFQKFYFCMIQKLDRFKQSEIDLPQEFQVLPIHKIHRGDLFELFVLASLTDEFELVTNMSDQQRSSFFDELSVESIFQEEASIALLKGEKLIGYSYLMKYDKDDNIHLNYMCVHPDYQKKGLGTLLLQFALQTASYTGYNTMTLYTDIERSALKLYVKQGFKEGGGTVTYRKKLYNNY